MSSGSLCIATTRQRRVSLCSKACCAWGTVSHGLLSYVSNIGVFARSPSAYFVVFFRCSTTQPDQLNCKLLIALWMLSGQHVHSCTRSKFSGMSAAHDNSFFHSIYQHNSFLPHSRHWLAALRHTGADSSQEQRCAGCNGNYTRLAQCKYCC